MKNLRKLCICILMLLMSACASNDNQVVEEDDNKTYVTYSATNDNEHAIEVDGQEANYENIVVEKTGDGEADEADFYGENAAIFASNGANLTIDDATITSDGKYGNAVFSYGEGTVVTISDSSIITSQRNSGGIMVTGGGTLYANNLTVETQGGSSAAIRSDRGGGTMVVDGGTYTANGSGSPAIYSTADVYVSNATLNSGSAQGIVVEGGNNVELNDCDVIANNTAKNSDKSDYYQAVMLYQSMSGDASGGAGTFKMNGGSLTSLNEGMFFVTNATYTIELSDVALTYASDDLLRICAAGWGNEGSNGGQVTFNLNEQKIEGIITVDEISKLNMYLTNNSDFVGSFENAGEVYVEIEDGSTWTLTSNCSITSLTCGKDCINLNGYTLTVNGQEYIEDSESSGEAIEFTVSESGNHKLDDSINSNNQSSSEKPDGENGESSNNPPEKPDGHERNDEGNPPEPKD